MREYTVKDYIELRHMIDEFHSIYMLPDETCKTYIDRVKLAADDLASAGRSLNNEDIAYRLLFGLSDQFRHLRTSLLSTRTDQNMLTTARVITAILSEERHLLNMSKRSSQPAQNAPNTPPSLRHSSHATTANATPLQPRFDDNNQNTPGPQRTRRSTDNRRQPYSNSNQRPSCTFCLGINHTAENCYLQFPEKHPNHPKNRQAQIDSPSIPPSPSLASRITSLPPTPSLESRITLPSETTNHVNVAPSTTSSESTLRFEYNYFSGPPGVGNGCCDWMLDSGTTSHFIKWKNLYRSFTATSPISIDTAGASSLTGHAIGIVPITVEIGEVVLRNVIYTPHLHTNCNLLSMTALDADGLNITFSNKKAYITRRHDNVLWATGSLRSNSLYFLDVFSPHSCFTLAPSLEDTQLLETWHKRLGHLSARNVTRLLSMSKGIKIGSPQNLIRNADCVDCLRSGQHRIPSHLPTHNSSAKLQLVHSDICGPMKVPAIGGKETYFATFIDDFTRMTWVYALDKKSGVFEAFQYFVAHGERECNIEKVQILRTDNAGEYISTKMQRRDFGVPIVA